MLRDRLLLLADDPTFEWLRTHGTLPGDLLVDAMRGQVGGLLASDLIEAIQAQSDRIVRCHPSTLMSQGESAGSASDQARDMLYGELLRSPICHLVVLDEHLPTEDGNAIRTLQGVIEWYERFRTESLRIHAHRRGDYRHGLILVCGEELSPDDFALLQQLTKGTREDKLVDLCHLMMHKPEMGDHILLHAEHIWPLATSRLLLELGQSLSTAGPPEESTLTIAWRSWELRPRVDSSQIDAWTRAKILETADAFVERLMGGDTPRDWDTALFSHANLQPPPQDLGREETPAVSDWHSYHAPSEVQRFTNKSNWSRRMRESGGRFREGLLSGIRERLRAIRHQVGIGWKRVGANPETIGPILAQKLPQASDAADQLQVALQSWTGIIRAQTRLDNVEADAVECAGVLEEAATSWVPWPVRVGIAAAVAFSVAWLGHFVLYNALGGFKSSLILAVSALVGGCLIGAIAHLLENRRGEQATRRFRSLLDEDLNAAYEARHDACQNAVEHAGDFWMRLRAAGSTLRFQRLLRRVHHVLHRELRSSGRGDQAPTEAVVDEGLSPQELEEVRLRESLGQSQRARYQAMTHLTNRHLVSATPRDDSEELKGLIERLYDSLVVELWQHEFSQRHDPRATGHLPASVLVQKVRRFNERFQTSLEDHVYRHAIRVLDDEGYGDLGRAVADVLRDHFDAMMSCPGPRDVFTPEELQTLLLLNPECEGRMGSLPSECVTEVSEGLRGAPIVGLVVQKATIDLQLTESGKVEATRR